MPEYQCDVCGKPYKSRSGLRDHRKAHRDAALKGQVPLDLKPTRTQQPAAPEPALGEGDNYIGPSPSDDLTLDEIIGDNVRDKAWLIASNKDDAEVLAEACQELGVDPDRIISFTVYPDDTVVMVVGPVGFKYTWTRGAKR